MKNEYFNPMIENRENFRKIKYVEGHRVLEDGSYYISTTVITPDGVGHIVDTHCVYENKHSNKTILGKKTFFIQPEQIEKFIIDVLHIVGNLEPWKGFWIDDCYGTLEISFIDNSMEMKLDRAISDGDKIVAFLFDSLMKTATFTEKEFKNGDANIYASYYDPVVNVVLDEDGNFYRYGEREICLYYFDGDSTTQYPNSKKMLFSKFINELIKNDIMYFGYAYSKLPQWMWHTDAYKSFTKENLDSFLKTTTKKLKERYLEILRK